MRITLAAAFIVLTTIVGAPPDASASITYEAQVGWQTPGPGGEQNLSKTGPGPQTASSGDFSLGGRLCPTAGSSDYFCANGSAEATSTPEGIALHASARETRHDATTLGVSYLLHGIAKVTMCNLSGAVAPAGSVTKFHIGLSGTASTSASNAGILVQAFGTAYFQGVPITCTEAEGNGSFFFCPPVTLPNWDYTGCTSLELRADVAFANQQSLTGWDADANANFADTMRLLAIEVVDENGQLIPDLKYSVTDAQGTPIIAIPNVVPVTTTTTAPSGGATTTTLPGGCTAVPTYDSVRCRLDALETAAGNAGTLAGKLTSQLTASRAAVDKAQADVGRRGGKASKADLRKALKKLRAYSTILASKKARRTIPDVTRAALGASLDVLRADVQGLPTRRQGAVSAARTAGYASTIR